nr:hypothetical protein [Lentzea kentuckyensis]
MSKRHKGPNIDGVDGSKNVRTGLRPSPTAANTPIFDVPDNKSVRDKSVREGPAKFQPVALVPKTTVNDDNSTLSRPHRQM